MTKITLHDYSGLYTAITKCQMKYSPKVLRHLKSDIYELVATNDPKGKLYVSNIDDTTNLDNVEFVIGVGIMGEVGRAGYSSIVTSKDLFEDVLFNNKNLVAEWIVEDSLPGLLSHHGGSLPMHKYLVEYQKTYTDIISSKIKTKFDDFLNNTIRQEVSKKPCMEKSIDSIIKNCNVQSLSCIGRTLRELLTVSHKVLDSEKNILGQFLINVWNAQENILNESPKSNYRKLVMIYDWLKYAKK